MRLPMKLKEIGPLGMFGVNCYLVHDGKCGVLIDAPDGFDRICSVIDGEGIELKMILLTHGHCDHIESAKRLSDKYGVKVYVHENDAKKLANDETNLSRFFGMPPVDPITDPCTFIDGDVISCGGIDIEVLHTPGHTGGSCCLIIDDMMFSGDTLFCGSMGRTDMLDGDQQKLFDSLAILFDFDTLTDYKVYPGHGQSTTLSEERADNQFMRYAAKQAGYLKDLS